MSEVVELKDAQARERIIEHGLHETLFVEAGAGTGKTTALVSRIVSLVQSGRELSSIAAITFTDAAAAELQTRIQLALGDHDVDRATITTVHGFAMRILSEFALDAALPPMIAVADEVSSAMAASQRWRHRVDELHADPAAQALLQRAALLNIGLVHSGGRAASIEDVVTRFGHNWDLLRPTDLDPLPSLDSASFDSIRDAIETVRATLDLCQDPEDKLYGNLLGLIDAAEAVIGQDDPMVVLRHLRIAMTRAGEMAWPKPSHGKAANWASEIGEIREVGRSIHQAAAALVSFHAQAVLQHLSAVAAEHVQTAAAQRRRDGQLEFHDLLVLARDVLRTKPEVRARLHERYGVILLDEFQDTDPIQIEVASLIAAAPQAEVAPSWEDLEIAPGRLFFVGDPKQSIYRFRRADISLYLAARDVHAPEGALQLRSNFRTVAPIIDWVNALFDALMPHEQAGAQPKYEPLDARRSPSPNGEHRPVMLGTAVADSKTTADQLREYEAADIARAVDQIMVDPQAWPVFDEDAQRWRPAQLGDITILIPARTGLRFLRNALDAAEIPYRLATGTLVYQTQEIRDVLSLVRAVADPADDLATVTALRSPLMGCSDMDLFAARHELAPQFGGPAELRSSRVSAALPETVSDALGYLASLRRQRWWITPRQLIDQIIDDRHAMLLGYGAIRPEETWRRLRFLQDQALRFETDIRGGLLEFLLWAEQQGSESARVHEPIPTDHDVESLSILTMHGAKGLEFPICVLGGMTGQITTSTRGADVVWGEKGYEVKLRAGIATAGYQERAEAEVHHERLERDRLLYVAATRARDHLIVSTWHKPARTPSLAQTVADQITAHPELWRKLDDGSSSVGSDEGVEGENLLRPVSEAVLPKGGSLPVNVGDLLVDADTRESVLVQREHWQRRRHQLIAQSAPLRSISATRVAALGHDEEQRFHGGFGLAIGRAVHQALERMPQLQFDAAALAAIDIAANAEDLGPSERETLSQLVRSALQSVVLDQARRFSYRRELYVAANIDVSHAIPGDAKEVPDSHSSDRQVILEGYIDLMVETSSGWIVADYKTDVLPDEGVGEADGVSRAELIARYEMQAAAYCLAIEAVTGRPVVGAWLVFCRVDQAPIDIEVTELDRLKRQVLIALDEQIELGLQP